MTGEPIAPQPDYRPVVLDEIPDRAAYVQFVVRIDALGIGYVSSRYYDRDGDFLIETAATKAETS